jgi:hypothetical protein
VSRARSLIFLSLFTHRMHRYEAWALFRRTILVLLGAVLADQTRATLLAFLCLLFYLVHVGFQVNQAAIHRLLL